MKKKILIIGGLLFSALINAQSTYTSDTLIARQGFKLNKYTVKKISNSTTNTKDSFSLATDWLVKSMFDGGNFVSKTYVDSGLSTKANFFTASAPLFRSGALLGINNANSTSTGALTSTDWNTFNNKVGTSTTISTTLPLQGGGDLSANRTLSIDSVNAARDGYLSKHDWSVFNDKLGTTGGTLTGQLTNSYNSIANTPASRLTGTWFTGGTSTTTKPHFLIEPAAAASSGWNANGTALGVNAAPGFIGNLIDLQFNGTSQFRVALNAVVTSGQFTAGSSITSITSITSGANYNLPNGGKVNWGGGNTFIEGSDTYFRVQVNGVERWRILANGKTSQPTTANSPKGTATLVNGVVTINNTLATTGCFIQVNYRTGTALSTTSSILTVSSIVASTSFTVTAYNAGAATTNTSDNNIIEYTISN